MSFPQRGGYARDRRTGAYVRVTEEGGADVMVQPVYRDTYWVRKTDLEPGGDPHDWTRAQVVLFLVLSGICLFLAYALGYRVWDAGAGVSTAVSAGLSGLASSFWVMGRVSGLWRP